MEWLALTGIAVGGGAAAALSRVLAQFVFQVSPLDALTFTGEPILVGAATIIATILPAQRRYAGARFANRI